MGGQACVQVLAVMQGQNPERAQAIYEKIPHRRLEHYSQQRRSLWVTAVLL